ncbi:penicillin-binding protein 1C [Serratia ficaria]|uniref:peptidoglycan glycosyltransferase n=1 Tax=Serratia ficaria TaxID=61651 RepID=A0A240C9B6_SERFI|nr:penicillin-binding protein 1C [Serratia ficaria]REF43354.1 penicillin-binding protein 1C [Serratia ficaria]CAI0694073.1 Penicillin-binding protein 4 precursor [Serratia ficaria]CAI1070158.1 Penicillin-binding protein 4 precursor [Serratia ficaria]CAI1124704.1 Penicillin-binding protein 4 precursor [Serratia ficaria]CAI2070920.1 Penicillin-binding protein 4 precursor [Serratia ficaria]
MKILKTPWLQNGLMAVFLLALTLAAIRLWPHPPLSRGLPLSSVYYDRHGALLRITLANDERYRLWTPLDAVSPLAVRGLLLHEDRWFYYNPGFNPIGLMRGFWRSYVAGGKMQGGSTISMQLARMRWHLNTRTPGGKLLQVLRAIQLELSYSKRDILEAYLNYAPYGRNIESIGAASLIYFGKAPRDLTLPEALTLAVLPQSPSYRLAPKTGVLGIALTQARSRLFQRWQNVYATDGSQRALFRLPLALRQPEQMPYIAPHFIEQLRRQTQQLVRRDTRVDTQLDARLQRLVERQVDAFIARNQSRGIHNAAVLLVDSRDMGVRALVGSADYYNRPIQGQVNGTNAKRSPGSTLKPFIYALGMEQGVLHPMTILKDVPSSFGAYAPENFDRRFLGPVTATDALNFSRNIPAVYVASQLRQPTFYQFLRLAGVANMASENHYGLSLVLGGGEVTAQELAKLYALLANRGELRPLRMLRGEAQTPPVRLLSEEASFITLDMLRQHRRPGDTLAQRSSSLPVYWKTGTSWGFRDAWSVGIFGPYVLVVWEGNFDSRGNNALVGAEAAAPLFFNIVDSVNASDPALQEPKHAWPKRLRRVDICLASGDLPTPWCRQKGKTWFIPGKSPIKVDSVYRPVVLDIHSGEVACPPYDPAETRTEVFEFWPSDLANVFAQAGLPKRAPPLNRCRDNGIAVGGNPPRITSPLKNTTYTLRQSQQGRDKIAFNAVTDADSKTLYWFVDDIYLGSSASKKAIDWRPVNNGRYRIRAVDDRGRADSRLVTIEWVN